MLTAEQIEQIKQIGIPERYLGAVRKDFPSGSQILVNVQSWIKDGDLVIFQGNRATEFLAVLSKYITIEFNQLVKWVDLNQLQVSYQEVDEDGRKKIFYYSNLPVLVIPDISMLDRSHQFDIERFLKNRWLHKLPTFCSMGQFNWRFSFNYKIVNIGD